MVDPISITSLIFETGSVIAHLISYSKSVRDSKCDIRKLGEELFALKGILEYLSSQNEARGSGNGKGYFDTFDPDLLSVTLLKAKDILESLLSDLKTPTTKLRRFKQKVEWPFTHKTFQTHLIRLERMKTCLMLILMSDGNSIKSDLHEKLEDLTISLREDLSLREKERLSSTQRDLFKWLAPVSPMSLHLFISRERVKQTGKWFIEEIFHVWLRSHEITKRVLLISGKSGSGKTTLCSHIVDELTSNPWMSGTFSSAFFYCTFRDTASQEPRNVLGSLLAQVAEANSSVLEGLLPLYASKSESNGPRPAVDTAFLEETMIKYLPKSKPVIFVIDAINESIHAEDLQASLQTLLQAVPNLRLVVTSTTTSTVFTAQHLNSMTINPAITDKDIEIYTRFMLQEDRMLKTLSEGLKTHILTTIVEGANGSFRWAQLSLESLRSSRTVAKIRETLKILPMTLQETYASILRRIVPSDRELCRKALIWVAFSKRPLILEELSEIVILEDFANILDEEMRLISPNVLLEMSQGLISEDGHGKLSLAHASVREFLTSEWIHHSDVRYFGLGEGADHYIMKQCLVYLCLENFQSGYVDSIDSIFQRESDYPFLDYAANFWIQHYLSQTLDNEGLQIILRLFYSVENFGVWVQTMVPEIQFENIESSRPLYYAASFNLLHVVRVILEMNPSINLDQPGGRFGSSPFFVACWRGHFEVAELLLQAGADPFFFDHSTDCTVFDLPGTSERPMIMEALGKSKADIIGDDPFSPSEHGSEIDETPSDGDVDDCEHSGLVSRDVLSSETDSSLQFTEVFEAQIRKLFPLVDAALVPILICVQQRRYERLMVNQKKHHQAMTTGPFPTMGHCTHFEDQESSRSNFWQEETRQEYLKQNNEAESMSTGMADPENRPLAAFRSSAPPSRISNICASCHEVPDTKAKMQADLQKDAALFACTFHGCPILDLFTTKESWLRHETYWHWRAEAWRCFSPDCSHTFYRKERFFSHVKNHIGQNHHFTTDFLRHMVSNSEITPAGPPDKEECLFCGSQISGWKIFMAHVGGHFDELAIPVLDMVKQCTV